MKEKAYYENVNVKNEVKLRKLLEQLPDFCKQFFIGIEPTTSSRTRIAYAYDMPELYRKGYSALAFRRAHAYGY